MSDTILLGVLRMPFELAMSTPIAQIQYHQRGVQAADETEKLRAEVERLREVLLHISRYETVGPAGFEWDIVVEELVTIARDALEAKP